MRIFLGLISEQTSCFGFLLRSVDQKNIHSNFFSGTCVPEKLFILSFVFLGVGNLDPRYFWGSKISGLCIFLGLQYEVLSEPLPPIKYMLSTPLVLKQKFNSQLCSNFYAADFVQTCSYQNLENLNLLTLIR